MGGKPHRIFLAATLVIPGVVAGAAIAQAIREHSWEPILSVAWLPAVLVVSFRRSADPRDLFQRLPRRRRS